MRSQLKNSIKEHCLNRQNKGFIIFYTPWCKYCKKTSDMFIDLALSNVNIFNFGSVNLEDVKNGNDYLSIYGNINKVPTLKYIDENGVLINYDFEYNNDNLIYFININI